MGGLERRQQPEYCGKLTLRLLYPYAKYLHYKELALLVRYAEIAGKLM
jgi:hypothetical protein